MTDDGDPPAAPPHPLLKHSAAFGICSGAEAIVSQHMSTFCMSSTAEPAGYGSSVSLSLLSKCSLGP